MQPVMPCSFSIGGWLMVDVDIDAISRGSTYKAIATLGFLLVKGVSAG